MTWFFFFFFTFEHWEEVSFVHVLFVLHFVIYERGFSAFNGHRDKGTMVF